jgi:hypothetical protein
MHPWGTMGKAREPQIILNTDQNGVCDKVCVGQWGCATMTCGCPITAERLATGWRLLAGGGKGYATGQIIAMAVDAID